VGRCRPCAGGWPGNAEHGTRNTGYGSIERPCTPPSAGTGVRPLTHWLRRRHLRRSLEAVGIREPILWLSHPDHVRERLDLPARLRVYHIVDEYQGYHGAPPERLVAWAEAERALIDWADLVIAVSPELIATKGPGNPRFRLLPNAVDAAAYAPEARLGPAPEMEDLPHPRLGYVGLVSVRLDLAMLDALAAARPEWTLVMVGSVYPAGCEAELARLRQRPNVRLIGTVDAARVPRFRAPV